MLIFFKVIIKKMEYHQSVKQFGFRSDPTLWRTQSGSEVYAKVITRQYRAMSLYNTADVTEDPFVVYISLMCIAKLKWHFDELYNISHLDHRFCTYGFVCNCRI